MIVNIAPTASKRYAPSVAVWEAI